MTRWREIALLCALLYLIYLSLAEDRGYPMERDDQDRLKSCSERPAFRGKRWRAEGHHLPMSDVRWGPLMYRRQLLIKFRPDLTNKEQTSAIQALMLDTLFVHFIPERSFLVLADPELKRTARELEQVEDVRLWESTDRLSRDWDSVLSALNASSLETLTTKPVYAFKEGDGGDRLENNMFGTLDVDRSGTHHRIIIEVGFPLMHKTPFSSCDDRDYHPARAAAKDWLPSLRSLFDPDIDAVPYHGILELFVPESIVSSVLDYLSLQPQVHWLHPKAVTVRHNWRASGIVQSGKIPRDESGTISDAVHPVWSAGLQGEGQIVGCGDSGVDLDHCFFRDPKIDIQSNIQMSSDGTIRSFFDNTDHRKIRFYGSSVDFLDADGHGTHVSGTLVGKPNFDGDEEANANRGMAPEAKLAFLDLDGRRTSNTTDSIYTPRELSTYYYPLTYNRGARIHSDSWGSDSPAYDHLAQEVDKFVWEHQDFLPIFAAGNYGQLSLKYLTTVTSPAVAKNCLAVGATLTANQRTRFENEAIEAYQIQVTVFDPEGGREITVYKILAAEFGASWNKLIDKDPFPLILGSPETGCSTLDLSIRRHIVLLNRGECTFVHKLKNVQARDGLGVIVVNDHNNGYFEMVKDTDETADSELNIPMGSIPASVGRILREHLESNQRITIKIKNRSEPDHAYDNIAAFSSAGPTRDYRIKPDIVAPGHIKSAWSDGRLSTDDGTCQLRVSSGTSMATPVVAGAAVLVRQYYTDGYYPTGKPNPLNEHTPSGALIKATLLGGAFPMDGYTEAGLPLDPPPSPRQGFGRVLLETSIPLQGSKKYKDGWKIQVVDGANLTDGASHEYCLRALGGPIRITLVWTDPPGSPSAAAALIHDLDLSVRSAGLKGRELLGNGVLDRANNVERVLVEDMPEGNLAIVVKAHRVAAIYGVQPYALVVQGRFNGILQSLYNPYKMQEEKSSDRCIITLAVLTSGPEGAVNDSNPEFVFTTQSGVSPVNGFECKLMDVDGNKEGNGTMHDWRRCSSPTKYDNLADKGYVFILRPKNEDVEVRREFVVDTRPPTAVIAGTPISSESAQESVSFEFSAEDLTPVVFHCRLDVEDAEGDVRIARIKMKESSMKLGQWFRCTSPESFRGLTYGRWTFRVRGEDKAGNAQVTSTKQSWSIKFSPNKYYVRTLLSPLATSASPTVAFHLNVITGDVAGRPEALDEEPIECRLFPVSNGDLLAYPYRACPRRLQFPNISDGTYGFESRTKNSKGHVGVSVALIEFSVDSTPPLISFSQRPEIFHGAKDLILKFQANEMVTGYNCSMRRSDARKRFNQCPGSQQGTVDYHLEDGNYTFQARARDLAGNFGYSEDIDFMIDATPPNITFKASEQLTVNTSTVKFRFVVDDGKGSGVLPQNQSCSLLNELSGAVTHQLSTDCTSPVSYDLPEGRYLFTMRAVDRAGLNNKQDLPIIVDFTPPSIEWLTIPDDDPQPSFVLFTFEGKDEPKSIASLVQRYQCHLTQRQTSRVLVQSVESTDGGRRLLNREHDERLSSRELLETEELKTIRIRNGPEVILGEWVTCSSPLILVGMSSGRYAFRVRAMDLAGNMGDPTNISLFTVDDTLPLPGEESEASESKIGISQTVAVALIGVSIGFVVLMCIVVCCWRRRSRRRKQEKRIARRREMEEGILAGRPGTETSSDSALEAAVKASLQTQRREEDRRLEVEEQKHVRLAMQRSLEQQRY